ncbi:MAG: RND transporter [Myxococcales bacterium 68-20]|nr:MAG: RND transporter [Myxococcales bacterium 68-20]
MVRRFVSWLVDFGGRFPYLVLGVALALSAASWAYASKLELRSDFLELLPRDSPGFRAFEHQLGRVGGGATLVVIAESPERAANERFIDSLAGVLEKERTDHLACVAKCGEDAACKHACGPELISYMETGTKEVRSFFQDNKWLYAELDELEDADRTIDRQVAIKSGMVEDLEAPDTPAPAEKQNGASQAPKEPKDGAATTENTTTEKKSALGLDDFRTKWEANANKHDDFPTGYFASPNGGMVGLRIISTSTGTGDAGGDNLLGRLKKHVEELKPASFHPAMNIGYAGDIPNAVAEKESLISEAAMATGLALVLILGGIAFFYRSMWAVPLVGFAPIFGVGCAYAFATYTFGFVNSSGAFLGAIILGNGVNYPIVLYSRYREFRARQMPPDVARREAVWNAFRAELVGASVASIAYGSLTITNFRGFSQFGFIGFVGMLLVWIAMIPCVPAMIVLLEKLQEKLPPGLRQAPPVLEGDGSRGTISRIIGDLTARHPRWFIGIAAVLTVVAVWKIPAFLHDPWEYNFHKLGSRGSHHGGAGEWSNKADEVFAGKMNIAGAMMLADTPEQVLPLKAQILANDAADPQGTLIADIATVYDLLPGTKEEQEKKLAVLERIRERLTPRVLHDLPDDERKRVEEFIPPETLRVVEPKDLPSLLRRRFEESNGVVGTLIYVRYKSGVSLSNGYNLLRIAKTTDNIELPDGTRVMTASRSTVFAEMIRSMERDGPLATFASFAAVAVVVALSTRNRRGTGVVLAALVLGVVWMVGVAAWTNEKLNFLNFIALPITFGIGSEYPFNIYDRSRLLGGDVTQAVKLHLGAVTLCSYTTIIGYGSLMIADNQALQSFGRLAAIGEIACLFAALFVLPSILHVVRRLFDPNEVHG